ncbi:carboxymuconolactone decarboxylase family protein [Streptomyces sp. SBT349]|uniref:carboxymuconolactone decarboxylase family protein n=1 Tax=Streptomyces sp. SBT349 TaxID=1580539 RepID=UPI00066B45E7|nr:carboxymuconolactone decarboxylase family protein [Streptomyces sp. SBT349]
MTSRFTIWKAIPEVQEALSRLSAVAGRGVEPSLKELVQLRASQINRCAYCVDMHSKDARAAGEREERLALVAAFDDAPDLFTEKERAALALTEAVTVLTDGFVPDAVYERAAAHFDERELAQLIATIAAINAWNRLNVAARVEGGHYRPGRSGGGD